MYNFIICAHKTVFTLHQKVFISNEGHESFVINSHEGIINFIMSVNEIFVNNSPLHNLSQELQ